MARPTDQRISSESILDAIQKMQDEGYDFSVGRPLKGRRGGFSVLSERLGLSVRYLQQVVKKAQLPPPSSSEDMQPPPDLPPPSAPRGPKDVLDDLGGALNAFVDEAISMDPRAFNPALIMWAEKGIELLQQKWDS